MSDTTPVPDVPQPHTAGTATPTGDMPPRRGGRAGLIAGSIVGGVLVIGLAFGGGTAVGWALGSHHGGPGWSSDAGSTGPGERGDDPGQWRNGDQGSMPALPSRPDQRGDGDDAPDPDATPDS